MWLNSSCDWLALPAATDLSCEADIARVKYFRNTVYGHAVSASVDDTTFNDYWLDIQDMLVRLGGVAYKAAIDTLIWILRFKPTT